jgi:hypothetical protein
MRPLGCPGVGRPQGIFGGLSYYQLVMLFSNIVPLIMEFTIDVKKVSSSAADRFTDTSSLLIIILGEFHDQGDNVKN